MINRSEYSDHQHMRNLALLTMGFVAFVLIALLGDKLVHKVQSFKGCEATIIVCLGKLDGTE